MTITKHIEQNPLLAEAHFLSPFGCFYVAATEYGLAKVNFVDIKPCPAGPIPELLKEAVQQLNAYFRGERQTFDLALDMSGHTNFEQSVWTELLKIPYGRTTSYSRIAEALGDPNYIRAVGQANRRNPVAIIVPCHRVIAKDGQLQGYFYGLDFKRRLLELENPMSFARQASLF